MDEIIRTKFDHIYSGDRQLQHSAFLYILEVTDKPVEWAYEVWNEMVAALQHKNNRVRAIAAQILCNLAKSDPKNRMLKDFDALLNVTKDERFVTARHCLKNIWKVGVVGVEQQKLLVNGFEARYYGSTTEKNCTLIRYDIIQGLRNLYGVIGEEKIREKALLLIESENDLKYRKKYASLWKEKGNRVKKEHKFVAVIEDAGNGGAYVVVPFDVEQAFGKKRVKVKSTIDGESYRGSLVRMGGSYHVLGVLKTIREKIGKNYGDEVEIVLEEDTAPREVLVPPDMMDVLKGNPEAEKFFYELSYTHQKEYIRWIEETKREQTRQRRLKQAVEMLKQQKKVR